MNLLPSILVSLVYCWLLSMGYFMEPVTFDTCLTCVFLVVINWLFYGTCYLRYLSHLCIVGCYQWVILWNLLPSILVSLVYCWLLSMGYFMEPVTFDTCLTCVLLVVINVLLVVINVLLVVINVLLVVINGLFMEPVTFDTCLTCVLLVVINVFFFGTCYLRYLSHLCIVGCYQWVIYGTCHLRYLSHLCIVGCYQCTVGCYQCIAGCFQCIVGCYQWVILWNLLPSILVSLVYCWLLSMGYFMEPVTFDTCLTCVLLVVINGLFYGTCYLRYLSHLCFVGCYQCVLLWNLLPSILVSLVYCWL